MKQQKQQGLKPQQRDPKAPQEQQPQASARRPGSGDANAVPAAPPGDDTKHASNRAAQCHQRKSQAAQLSAANVEESPHMDRGDSAGGSGETVSDGTQVASAGESLRRGALDTQYGTRSGMKTEAAQPAPSGSTGPTDERATDAEHSETPNPGSSEKSSSADRDTMSGPRSGGRA